MAQLDDYILPRYRSLDAPLLAVVGGSTGAGKSTLVNALVGHPVTRAGAIRPTTRQPILLHHPDDAAWFEDQRVLPEPQPDPRHRVDHSRCRPPRPGPAPDTGAVTSLVLAADPAVPPGIALLDAPDVDSVSDDNRRLAGQLLAAADLWVFVTTANRYADAVPWRLLLDAAARDIMVAVVLDRVPPAAEEEVSADLPRHAEPAGTGRCPAVRRSRGRSWTPRACCPQTPWTPLRRWLEETRRRRRRTGGDCPPHPQRHGQGAGRPGAGRRGGRHRPAAAPPPC